MYEYTSLKELIELCEAHNLSMSEVILYNEATETEEEPSKILELIDERIEAFKESIRTGMEDLEISFSGMVGGDGNRLFCSSSQLIGVIPKKAAAYAMAVNESNAKMFKIVACPTAGASGIVPGTVFAVGEELQWNQEQYRHAFLVAGGIGKIIARNACIAGAVGGCQAEVGTAAAMATAAIGQIMGLTPVMIGHAVALCLKNVMGLVCDPVAGLVEVPCVKRNAFFAVHSLTAVELALAGIESVIPVDEVISAVDEVGRAMPKAYRETAEGGLAITPTGLLYNNKINGEG